MTDKNQRSTKHTAGSDEVIGRALTWSLWFIAAAGLVAGSVWFFARPDNQPEVVVTETKLPEVRQNVETKLPHVTFTDVTDEAGIAFVHCNGAIGGKFLPETMGSGAAFFDYDNDGDQDLLLVNACDWPWDKQDRTSDPSSTVLYANDGSGQFTDVTGDTGLSLVCYGQGIAVGDYDNDGYVDVFLSAVGRNHLFQNKQGHFVDTTESADLAGADNDWSSSAAFFDYDNDGDLDLYVCNYVHWSKEIDEVQGFQLTGIGRAYGPPTSFEGAQPYLYRNEGEGEFVDVSESSGVWQHNESTGVALAKSLAVVPIDYDRDGWIDLIAANDTVRNLVFHNRGDGTFEEVGILVGVAFDSNGRARGAMGIDAAYFRDDDSLGIAVANFANEMTALYVASDDGLLFTDDAIPSGLGPPTRAALSFGLFFFDFDLDGRLDLLAANGHLENEINAVQESQHYRQPAQLFWNAGAEQTSEFVQLSAAQCGGDLFQPIVGRGATYADIDSDGDLDALLTQVAGPPLLLRNDLDPSPDAYLRFQLVGRGANRDAIGAWIEADLEHGTIRRQVMPTRSYLSQVELPVTIGTGGQAVRAVRIRWPGGDTVELDSWEQGRVNVVQEQ